jgi:hypothetical protein
MMGYVVAGLLFALYVAYASGPLWAPFRGDKDL